MLLPGIRDNSVEQTTVDMMVKSLVFSIKDE